MLLALVVATPLLSLGLIAANTKQRSDNSVRSAEELQSNLRLGMDLAELELFARSATITEPVLSGLAQVGLSPKAAGLILGIDADESIADSLTRPRTEIAERLERLELWNPDGPASSLGRLRTDLYEMSFSLAEAATLTDSGELDEAGAADYYLALHEHVEEASAQAMNEAFDLSAGEDFGVLRDVAALRSLIAAHGALVIEQEAVVAAAFGGQFLPPGAGDWVGGIAAAATYEHQVVAFERTASAPLLKRWKQFQASPNQQLFSQLRSKVPDFLAPDRTVDDFDAAYVQVLSFNQLVAFVDVYLDEERQLMDNKITGAVASFSTGARSTYRLAAVTGIVTLVFSIFTVQLLLRPLGELRRRAAAMTNGEAGLDALGPIGPREIAQVAVAMDDVGSNLVVIEGQLDAISDRRFDDEVLATRLPGAVGQSLEQSMRSAFESSASLNEQARIDALTELPNRLEMVERLEHALTAATPTDAVAVVFVDLDRFKPVNDRLGHEAGDQVLIQAARRFEATLAPNESLGRIGGDEFLAVATGVSSVAAAVDLAKRLVDAASDPIVIAGREIDVSASAGVVVVTEPGKSSSQVLHEADLGLYESKGGVGRVTFVTDELTDRVHRRTETVDAFAAALGTGGVELHLQPIVDIHTEHTVAAEGLLRWTRDGQPVSPGEFIPIIESSDLIHDVGRWVLAEAARHAARILAATGRLIPISVNISWHHLEHGDLVGDVKAALHSAGVEGAALCVEFTESTPPPEARHIAMVIEELAAMGVGIWLDDFGTGYTSITQLRDLAFDVVKLDRSFVSASVVEGEVGMTQALIDIITLMQVPVIAEGIETPEELARMRAAGARHGQGWYWNRDLPIERFLDAMQAAATTGLAPAAHEPLGQVTS